VARGVKGQATREREEGRLERQVALAHVERDGEHERPPFADRALEHRGRAIVEAGEHVGPDRRLEPGVALEPRRGERGLRRTER
jgi:hypothetical protein